MFDAGDEYADDETTSGPLEWCEAFYLEEPDPLDDDPDPISGMAGMVDVFEVDQ